MLTDSISAFGERRLGDAANALSRGRPRLYFRPAKSLVVLGLALRLLARRTAPRERELASFLYLAAGLLFRFTWVYPGRASARDDDVVAAIARDQGGPHGDPRRGSERRALSFGAPRCRFRASSVGLTVKRSGSRASRSSGACARPALTVDGPGSSRAGRDRAPTDEPTSLSAICCGDRKVCSRTQRTRYGSSPAPMPAGSSRRLAEA